MKPPGLGNVAVKVGRAMRMWPWLFRPLLRFYFRIGLRVPAGTDWAMNQILHGLRPDARDAVVRMRGGLRIKTSLETLYGLKLYFYGIANRHLIDALNSLLRPGDAFIDAGANIGEITLAAARRVGPRGRVISVEASPKVADLLSENVALNGLKNVAIVRTALAESDGKRTFYIASDEHPGSSSLTVPEGYQGRSIVVDCMRLDTVVLGERLSRVDCIKLDVEGAELDALKGATTLLSSTGHRPIVLVEYHAEVSRRGGWDLTQLVALFRGHEYEVHTLTGFGYGPTIDVLAVEQSVTTGAPYRDLVAVPRERERAS